ncbi:MAG: paraquat-inducible protein A [Rhodospirillaceae bacterium]|nr:MAG: paraquat-inducible protein A [Rhodospirillaceae bacterium]
MPAEDALSATPLAQPQLRECPGCGLLQSVPALGPGTRAQCARCRITLYSVTTHPLGHSIALNLASLVLMAVMCATTLMSVQTAGITLHAGLFSGPEELMRRGMAMLAIVVIFVTVLAPTGKLLGTLYVLIRLHERSPPRHARRVFALAEKLRPWSMIEVFILGVFVAYVKLGDLVHISLETGVFALMALTITIIWTDAALDREMIWERLGYHDPSRTPSRPDPAPVDPTGADLTGAYLTRADLAGASLAGAVGCETCHLVSLPRGEHAHCPRCGSALHRRKPNSVSRTWALIIAATVLYIPANYYPVLTVMQLGAGAPSTILGGVEELLDAHMYPLAALVFFASIAVPVLKLVGLAVMLVTVQTGRAGWLRDRTKLYFIVHWIGRWSMVDIFMESLLGALVRFGAAITIEPGMGAVAFCGVVILTMFAAETFDPRLMWDAAAARYSSQARRNESVVAG